MNKPLVWSLIIAILCWFVYISNSILTPFIIAFILAYLMSPLASFLESRLKIHRGIAAFILVLLIAILFISIWVILIPIIYEQISSFIKHMPEYRQYLTENILSIIASHFDVNYQEEFSSILDTMFAETSKIIISFLDKMWRSGLVFINAIAMLVLVPLITFYFIRDWHSLTGHVEKLVPVSKKNSFRELAQNINAAVSGFIRGQLNICIILAIYYSAALSLVKLNFSVLLGITTGILSFVPFLGLLGGFAATSIVALFQYHSLQGWLLVVAVFAVGNALEGIIGPRLIGKKIGVNPIWIVFFVLLGGSLFDFRGMLLAVPIGTIVSVLIKFTVQKYYNSSLYKS